MCDNCKCSQSFSSLQMTELIKTHGLRAILIVLAVTARTVAREDNHPGYGMIANKLDGLAELIRR